MKHVAKYLFLVLALLYCSEAVAQTTVRQSGNITPGHPVRWVTTGVIADGGSAAQGLLTGVGVTAQGPSICANSGAITGAFNRICLGVTDTAGEISLTNNGGATGGFTFSLNGVAQGIVTATLPVTAGNFACFTDSTGTIGECGGGGFTPFGTAGYALIGNGASVATFQGFTQAGSGATTRTWQAKAQDIISVKDFGATCDGTTNDRDALNTAVTAATTAGGYTAIMLPVGCHLKINTALSNITASGIWFICSAQGACRMTLAAANTFVWTSGATYGGMDGIYINASAGLESSSLITLTGGAQYQQFKNLVLDTGVGTFATIGGTGVSNRVTYPIFQNITGVTSNGSTALFEIVNAVNPEFLDNSVHPNADVGTVTSGRSFVKATLAATDLLDATIIKRNDTAFWDYALDVSISNDGTDATAFGPLQFTDNLFDSTKSGGIRITINTSPDCTGPLCSYINQANISNNFFAVKAGSYAIEINGGAKTRLWGVTINNNTIRGAQDTGTQLNGIGVTNTGYVQDLKITNNLIYNLDTAGATGNGTAGIVLTGGTAGTGVLAFITQTGNFTTGQVITGGTSGATGTISTQSDSGTIGTLYLTGVSGTFASGEVITDPLGGSATVSGDFNNNWYNVTVQNNNIASQDIANVLTANTPDYGILIQGQIGRLNLSGNNARGALNGINTQTLIASTVQGNIFYGQGGTNCSFAATLTTNIFRDNQGCQTTATVTPLLPPELVSGASAYVVGDLLYANATTTLAKLAAVATGSVLVSQGVSNAPAYSTTPQLGASGTLGTITFGNATSGTILLTPASGALGTRTITMPAASGTIAVSATSPITLSAAGDIACPTCSTITAAALTKTDDTNVTLTLGGTPTTALLQATSLTLGWTGTLSPARGGTGVANNAASTITISGAFGTTFTVAAATSLQLPAYPSTGLITGGTTNSLRPKATGNVTYNVSNATGSDVPSCGASGTPCDSIQYAINLACGIDLGANSGTIQLTSGETYTENLTLCSYVGAGPWTINGASATPSNYTLTASSGNVVAGSGVVGAWSFNGLRVSAPNGGVGFNIDGGTVVKGSSLQFITTSGAAGVVALAYIYVKNQAIFDMIGGAATNTLSFIHNATSTVDASYAIFSSAGFIRIVNYTTANSNDIAFTASSGNPTFSYFLYNEVGGRTVMNGNNYTGTNGIGAGGATCNVNGNSVAFTGGTVFPAGSCEQGTNTATGGQIF